MPSLPIYLYPKKIEAGRCYLTGPFSATISTLLLCLLTLSPGIAQPDWTFDFSVVEHDYYLLKGEIAGQYPITMQLFTPGFSCGDQQVGRQWHNRGLRGWYRYDRIGQRIPLLGSINQGDHSPEIRLFVPPEPLAEIDPETCEVADYREVFLNASAGDITSLQWKQAGDQDYQPVRLRIEHDFRFDTDTHILLRIDGVEIGRIDVNELTGLPQITTIEEVASSVVDDHFHLIFRFSHLSRPGSQGGGQCGAGVERYLGYLHLDEQLRVAKFDHLLTSSCWQRVSEEIVKYDPSHPEGGIRRINKE